MPRSDEPAMPPMDAGAVRRLLKDGFVGGGTEDSEAKMNETMFAALRRANDLSSVIFPGVHAKNFPSSLPMFDFSGSAVLPGEHSTFNFFEARYREMAREIIDETSGTGFFLLRGSAPSPLDDGVFGATVLLKVMEHTESADGQHACLVLAGPRKKVVTWWIKFCFCVCYCAVSRENSCISVFPVISCISCIGV